MNRQKLSIIEGMSKNILFTHTDKNNNAVSLDGATLHFVVKRKQNDTNIVFDVLVENISDPDGTGIKHIPISTENSKKLTATEYFWYCEVIKNGEVVDIPIGDLNVTLI